MSPEHDSRRGEAKSAAASDDAIKILTDILKQVGAGLQPRPLSETAAKAVDRYNNNRLTLDHDIQRGTTT
jgi:hypothetical protein